MSIFVGSGKYPQSDEAKISRAFETYFGFPLKVTLAGLGPHPTVVQRLQTEGRSGIKPPVDIFVSSARLVHLLRQAELVEPVDWVGLGIPVEDVLPPGDATYIFDNIRALIYNTRLLPSDQAPRRFEDLLDPKYGKVVVPAFPTAFPYVGLALGDQQAGLDFMARLAHDGRLAFVPSYTDVPDRVASGEFAVGYSVLANNIGHKDRGAPVENAPLERVAGFVNHGVVLRRAEHPAAAKVFTYFITSTDAGQRVIDQALRWNKHTTRGTESWQVAGEGKGIFPSPEWHLNDEEQIAREYGRLLGL